MTVVIPSNVEESAPPVVVLSGAKHLLISLRRKQVLRLWLRTTALLLLMAGALSAQSADARLRAQREELDRIRKEREALEQRMNYLASSVHDMREEMVNLDH